MGSCFHGPLTAVPLDRLQRAVRGFGRLMGTYSAVQLLAHVAIEAKRLEPIWVAFLGEPIGQIARIGLSVSGPVIVNMVKAKEALIALSAARTGPSVMVESSVSESALTVFLAINAWAARKLCAKSIVSANDAKARLAHSGSPFSGVGVPPAHAG